MKPKFFFCTDEMRKMWNEYGVFFSEKFCLFFSDKVEEIFLRHSGLKPSTKVGLSSFKQDNDFPMYETGEISKIRTSISILPEFHDDISFCWKSKSGKIIKSTDEDFDEEDLEYWIEGLKPILYWEQVSSTIQKHPFQSNLPFKLVVRNFGTLMNLLIKAPDEKIHAEIISSIEELIKGFNENSERNSRKFGVVHNFKITSERDIILLSIDLGSAGLNVINRILKLLSSFDKILQVDIDL